MAGTAASAVAIALPKAVHAKGSDTLKVGLIGCGGRGTGAAVDSFNADPSVVIWAMGDLFKDSFGGADKGLPIDRLIDFISGNAVRCILIQGTGSDRVLEKLPHIETVGTMRDAVAAAAAMSQPGDNIVLSPAFASFGVFKNEYDRSDRFMVEAQNLIDGRASCRR